MVSLATSLYLHRSQASTATRRRASAISLSRLRPTTLYPPIEGLIGDPFARDPNGPWRLSVLMALASRAISIVLRNFHALFSKQSRFAIFSARSRPLGKHCSRPANC